MSIEIHIEKQEVLRYLGMRRRPVQSGEEGKDETPGESAAREETAREEAIRKEESREQAIREVEPLIDEAVSDILRTAQARIVWKRFPLTGNENGSLRFAGLTTDSRSLARNLSGCSEVILLGATLGTGVDRLIERAARTRISKAVVLQAAAAAAIEDYLNSWQKLMEQELAEEGLFLRPRFSPGYGDFPLAHQPHFITVLEAAKKIGLTCTDSLMLAPVKSVTALIGLSKEDTHCIHEGCESCENTGCAFRR